jgi:hypothetical protein
LLLSQFYPKVVIMEDDFNILASSKMNQGKFNDNFWKWCNLGRNFKGANSDSTWSQYKSNVKNITKQNYYYIIVQNKQYNKGGTFLYSVRSTQRVCPDSVHLGMKWDLLYYSQASVIIALAVVS